MQKDDDPRNDYWSHTGYIVNFKKDEANAFAKKEGARFNWIARGLLPVDWYYRFAGKDRNMGWLNLNNIYQMESVNGYTEKTIRSWMTGVVPDASYEKDHVMKYINQQNERLGFDLKLIDQQTVIDEAMKMKRGSRYARR